MSGNSSGFEVIKPRNVLCDLPLLVKERIVRHADMVTKLSLQQCSKDFKSVVERSPKEISRISITVKEDSVSCDIQFDWLSHIFAFDREHEYDSCDVREAIQWFRKHVPSRVPVTLEMFAVQMHSHIRETGQTVRERMGLLMGNIQQILSTRRYKLNVGVLRIDIDNDEQGILKVLPYLEPGAIETFAVITSSEDPISLDTIVELDQWKQMKRLLTNVNISLTFDKLKHFEEVNFHVEHLTSDMVKEIVTHFISTPGPKSLDVSLFRSSDSAAIRSFLQQFGPAVMEKQRVDCPETGEIVAIRMKQTSFKVRKGFDGALLFDI